MEGSNDHFDIVISFDSTYSMYSCLDNVKSKMHGMIRLLKSKIPDIRMGVIAHGDYDTDLYLIKYEDLTSDADTLCSFVSAAGCNRGSTMDECYELALHYSRTKMSWRVNSSRTLVLIGDCRPHEAADYQNKQNIDWEQEITLLRDMNVKINAVQCQNRTYADSFYQKIASTTFGHYVSLNDIRRIEEVLISICYREAGLGMETTVPPVLPSSFIQPNPSALTPMCTDTRAETTMQDNSDFDSESDSDDQSDNGMSCPMCNTVKPPNEFPSTTASEDCEHALLECLRCVVKHITEEGTCPDENCNVHIDSDCQMVQFFQAKLDRLFVDYSKVLEQRTKLLKPGGDLISISTINGDTEWFPFRPYMRIGDLKQEISEKLGVRVEEQRLIYNDTNLKTDAKLSDYNIPSNSNISLIMPLYCIPEHLDHVVFDLSWEFPPVNPDFLDATCMAFRKDEFVQVIDWTHSSNKYYLSNSIKHSEKNLTDPGAKTGHQTIHVHLKSVPGNITHLYFTLSSWRSPNLSEFRNPSLKFYEASSENVNLCETTFGHALSSQAVIMCSVVRAGTKWQIFECGAGSLVAGNAKCYNPIRARIAELIQNEL
ncbi:uncharacterized protein LOC123549658 [Mercenaria mercenaria]|uniref:uncharacterized protein LOC123549658 n=1 Tax=Mercenaria mercenaria TaxID=6596 RepID=UPI00234F4777|nr:uncharacterized protein LOC123549658 [Mercenaria mercenaria]